MANYIFLAQCMHKDHSQDAITVTHMMKIQGIDDAFETHVPYKGHEFCLAATSHSKPREHKRIISKLLKDSNIKSVKMLSLEDSPF